MMSLRLFVIPGTILAALAVLCAPAFGADTDADGLPDDWETQYFGSLGQNDRGDADADGYSNLAEYRHGTNPAAAETAPPYLSGVTWESVGAGGGGAQYFPTPAPNNADLMFGACDMGGFYRSTDGGRHWRMVDGAAVSHCPSYYPDDAAPAFNRQDENIALAARKMGLARTADGGITWARVASVEVRAVAFHPGDGSCAVYLTADNRMFESSDYGVTWTEETGYRTVVNRYPRDLVIDAFSAPSSATMYVTTDAGVYKTTDGGATWAQKNAGLPTTDIVYLTGGARSGSLVLYASTGSAIYKSTNGAEAWTNTTANLPGGYRYSTVAACESNADVAYVGSNEEGGPTVYRTANGGATWTLKLIDPSSPRLPATTTVERDWMTVHYGWTWGEDPHHVAVCPTDPDVVAFSEDGRTWRSDDGGDTWFCCNNEEKAPGSDWWKSTGFEVTTVYGYYFDPRDWNRRYICYTDMALHRSEDAGESWRWCGDGSPWQNTFYDMACDPTAPARIWAVASNNHDLPHHKMLRQNELNFNGGVLVSNNWGASWSDLGHSSGLPTGACTSIALDPTSGESARTLWVTVLAKGVYKSTDGGTTWTAKNSGLGFADNIQAWQIERLDDGTLLCACTLGITGTNPNFQYQKGGLFRSTNGGDTWTLVNTTQDLPWIVGFSVDPTDKNKIYAGGFGIPDGSGGYVVENGGWRSLDGGATWAKIIDGVDVWKITVDPERPSRLWAGIQVYPTWWSLADYDGEGVWLSEDRGNTWTQAPTFPFKAYGAHETSFDPRDSQNVWVGTFGGGVWKARVPHADAPNAAFTATPETGEKPLEVDFSSTASTGNISTYTWGFDDGTYSHEASPTHTFAEIGTYTVTLKVEGPAGTSTAEKEIEVVPQYFVDTDGDDLADGWEMEFFGDLDEDGDGDADGDGETNAEEFAAGTDPTQGDAEPPVVSAVATIPTQVRLGIDKQITLTAFADDSEHGNSDIAAAEYRIGTTSGTATAMTAADGQFNEPSEGLTAVINTSTWTAANYRIYVRARDGAGHWSSYESILVPVVDGTPPSGVADLKVSATVSLAEVYAGPWQTAGAIAAADEETVIDLGAPVSVGGVSLAPLPTRPSFFPTRFAFYGSTDATSWTFLAGEGGWAGAKGTSLWQLEGDVYRYVKMTAKPVLDRNDAHYYVKVAELAIYETVSGNAMRATWRATADDGSDAASGPAAEYDLRFSASSIGEANFAAAERVDGVAAPSAKGMEEEAVFSVGGLVGRVYAAVRVGDEVPNWSPVSNSAYADAAAAGLAPAAPADGVTLDPAGVPRFEFSRGPDVTQASIVISDRPDFPARTFVNPDGSKSIAMRFTLKPGSAWWKPTANQWKSVKRLASKGTVYWRLEGKSAAYVKMATSGRAILFDAGGITDLAVSPSHGLPAQTLVWPSPATPPGFSWTDNTRGMKYFYVDVSTDPGMPMDDREASVVLGKRGISGSAYTATAAEWKTVRKLAAQTDGAFYWRVRAQDADKAFTVGSAAAEAAIDGGTWSGVTLDLTATPAQASWQHAGEGYALYSIEICADGEFTPGARTTLCVPSKAVAGGPYTFTEAEVKRVRTFALRAGATTLYWRIRAQDAERAYATRSAAQEASAP